MPAADALDPGDGSFPNFPRFPDGSPAWADLAPPGYKGAVMPRGLQRQRTPDGQVVLVDLTPRDAAGAPINPPAINPHSP